MKPEPPIDNKAMEPPELVRSETELAEPSVTNQDSPSTAPETAEAN